MQPKILSGTDLEARLASRDELFLIDLRDPRSFHARHIPDSILLPADDFADRYSREIDPEDSVVLVCERGRTALEAAKFLHSQGFTDVSVLDGGMTSWNGPAESTR